MKPAVALPLALVFALLLAMPVSAARPVIDTGEWQGDWEFPAGTLCPSITVNDHLEIHYRQMTYLDNEGNPLRIEKHICGYDNFSNPDTPGVVLSGNTCALQEIDAKTGAELGAKGLAFHITVPGYGTVLVAAGNWSLFPFDHVAGKDSFASPEDLAQFCAALVGS